MNNKTPDDPLPEPSSPLWVAIRLAIILALALTVSLILFLISEAISKDGGGGAISLSILVVLPYALGSVFYLLSDLHGQKPKRATIIPVVLVLLILIMGAIILREGVICVAMLAPLWWLFAWFGATTVKILHNRYRKRTTLHSSILLALPFLMLIVDANTVSPITTSNVERSVLINATPNEIWPHLLKMDDIQQSEGRWNVTQNILQVHRPRSAIVIGEETNAIRYAAWGDDITFEEHIRQWHENEDLRWEFVFANDSVQKYTDRHISPDGAHLKIQNGGYRLEPINAQQTRLFLDTNYLVSTPVNTYGTLWGELILGDIQSNILHIVKTRAEHHKGR